MTDLDDYGVYTVQKMYTREVYLDSNDSGQDLMVKQYNTAQILNLVSLGTGADAVKVESAGGYVLDVTAGINIDSV